MEHENKKLSLDSNYQFNHSFKKSDILRIQPTSGSIANLNKNGDIKFQSLSSENPLDISNCFLYYKVEIEDLANNEDITLENDFFPALFSQIRLKLGSSEVETVHNPGVYSTMLNLIMTNESYKKECGMITGWIPDNNSGDLNDKSYIKRKALYNTKKQFEGYFPLNKLFGFLQCYQRILYFCPIELILSRNNSNENIFFGAANTQAKIKLNSLEFIIPELSLNPKSEVSIIERLNSDKPIAVNYLNRICSTIDVTGGTSFSFKPANIPNKPKYILMGFKDRNILFTVNNNLFIQTGLKSLQLQLNNSYYPVNRMEFDIEKNEQMFPYHNYIKMCKSFTDSPQLSLINFRDLYPIFCFDVSHQDDKLVTNGCDITVHITKTDAFQPRCYVLILEEKHCEIKLNKGKFVLFETISSK